MPNEHAEIPAESGRHESLGPPTKVNRRLYMAVILVLGAVLLIGVIGWLLLAADDKSMPEGLGVMLGTVAGGLVGLIGGEREK